MVLCAVVPRPITVWSVNCTGRAYKVRNDVLSNNQQSGSVINSFIIDQSKFEGIMTPSGRRAPHCGKIQLPANIMMNTWNCFVLPLLNKVVGRRERNKK